jgi:hypothetical protein
MESKELTEIAKGADFVSGIAKLEIGEISAVEEAASLRKALSSAALNWRS